MLLYEQRPASLGADARELCEIVHIEDASENKLAIPFFGLENTLCSWLINLSYRLYRGDNTLIYYVLNNLVSKLNCWCERIKNRFGFCPVSIEVEAGTQDGQRLKRKYYLMSKEIYGDKFSTACYEDFFNEKALKSAVGLGDMREYSDTVASFEELSLQNSYFFNDLTNLRKK